MGSNRLEILIPFQSNALDLQAQQVVTNKVQEMIEMSFLAMNKSVDSMQLYELNEYAPDSYRAIIDVELSNAIEFALVSLLIENSQVRVDESSKLLQLFREGFQNATTSLNLKPAFIKVDVDNVQILFDQKDYSMKQPSRLMFNGSEMMMPTTELTSAKLTTTSTSTTTTSTSIAPNEPTTSVKFIAIKTRKGGVKKPAVAHSRFTKTSGTSLSSTTTKTTTTTTTTTETTFSSTTTSTSAINRKESIEKIKYKLKIYF